MRELLAKLVGKKLDMFCGGTTSLRGKLVKVDEGVAHMVDEDDEMFYVAIERIIVFSETRTARPARRLRRRLPQQIDKRGTQTRIKNRRQAGVASDLRPSPVRHPASASPRL